MPKNITEQLVTGGDIRSVMRKLESLGSRIVFVVDDKKKGKKGGKKASRE